MELTDSILDSTKKMLGIDPEYEVFDPDIITNINSVFFTLKQLGIGPKKGFMIMSSNEIWTDFMGEGPLLNAVIQYVYLKVKQVFDPPMTGSVSTSYDEMIKELEYRMYSEAEFPLEET